MGSCRTRHGVKIFVYIFSRKWTFILRYIWRYEARAFVFANSIMKGLYFQQILKSKLHAESIAREKFDHEAQDRAIN